MKIEKFYTVSIWRKINKMPKPKKDVNNGKLENFDKNNPAMLDYSERTEWRERLIMTWAKAISLVVFVIAVMSILVICAWYAPDKQEAFHTVVPIISGILSFIAGRKIS